MKFAHLLAALGIASMASVSAHAAPITLDFEGIGNGAEILDFYNGGTDSYGNRGVNYGVSFSRGAIAQRNAEGVYLKEGNFSLTFSSALGDNGQPGFNGSAHGSAFTFLYSATPPAGSIAVADVRYDSGFRDITNPYTPTVSNRFVGGSLSGTGPINTITFLNMAIDNFTFGPSAVPADRIRSNDIPEPATLALLGIGALGLIASRKKQAA